MKMRAVITTTHLDRHGERFTKAALEQAVSDFHTSQHTHWTYWNHQTTLPPIGYITDQFVEARDDGEYQLVAEIILLGSDDTKALVESNIAGINATWDNVQETLRAIEPSEGHLVISYDPRNIDPSEAEAIIHSIGEIVDARQQQYVRKAELPQPVIWVAVAFAGGFIARLGELTADKALSQLKELNRRFAQLFAKSKPKNEVDVIFNIPMPNSVTVVEGAVEDATGDVLEPVWHKLPELYGLAAYILSRNRHDYFSDMKFIYNPSTRSWELNYLTIRRTRQVILGLRYYVQDHPLAQRWEEQRELMDHSRSGPADDAKRSSEPNPPE